MYDNSSREPVKDDDDLEKRSKTDNYHIQRIMKFTIVVLFLLVCVVITIVVIVAIISEKSWRDYAIKAVFNNIPGIIGVILVAVGLRKAL